MIGLYHHQSRNFGGKLPSVQSLPLCIVHCSSNACHSVTHLRPRIRFKRDFVKPNFLASSENCFWGYIFGVRFTSWKWNGLQWPCLIQGNAIPKYLHQEFKDQELLFDAGFWAARRPLVVQWWFRGTSMSVEVHVPCKPEMQDQNSTCSQRVSESLLSIVYWWRHSRKAGHGYFHVVFPCLHTKRRRLVMLPLSNERSLARSTLISNLHTSSCSHEECCFLARQVGGNFSKTMLLNYRLGCYT